VICLATDSDCYVPLKIVDSKDSAAKCYNNFCYAVGSRYNAQKDIINQAYANQNKTVCIDDSCFLALQLT
jgi:hypothetical protein